MEEDISETTGIPANPLRGEALLDDSVAERMRWAKNGKTLRKEDDVYYLLGVFDIYLPLIYGEASNAFIRPDEAIE